MQIAVCDGSSLENPGPSKIGVGYWERFQSDGRARRFTPTQTLDVPMGVPTKNDARGQAVLRGCDLVAARANSDAAYIYTDSLLVVSQINCSYRAKQVNTQAYLRKFQAFRMACE